MTCSARLGILPWLLCLPLAFALGCGGTEENETADAKPASSDSPAATSSDEPARPANIYPRVVINTNMGEMVLELDAAKAPITVQNFLDYVDNGHYDNTIFHHVVSGMIVLGGGFTPEYDRKTERTPIYNEADNGLKNLRGTVAMARLPGAVDSATCQFFVNVADNPDFDYKSREGEPEDYGYCVFGRVIQGMDIVDKLSEVPVTEREEGSEKFPAAPTRMVRIDSIRRY